MRRRRSKNGNFEEARPSPASAIDAQALDSQIASAINSLLGVFPEFVRNGQHVGLNGTRLVRDVDRFLSNELEKITPYLETKIDNLLVIESECKGDSAMRLMRNRSRNFRFRYETAKEVVEELRMGLNSHENPVFDPKSPSLELRILRDQFERSLQTIRELGRDLTRLDGSMAQKFAQGIFDLSRRKENALNTALRFGDNGVLDLMTQTGLLDKTSAFWGKLVDFVNDQSSANPKKSPEFCISEQDVAGIQQEVQSFRMRHEAILNYLGLFYAEHFYWRIQIPFSNRQPNKRKW